MSSNLIRRVCVPTILTLGLLTGGQAYAVPYSWDYSFDTPIFEGTDFDDLEAQLGSAGPTIEGNFSFNSSAAGSPEPNGSYLFDPGSFSHTGELESLADSSGLFLATDSDFKLSQAFFWTFGDYTFDIHFGLGNSLASYEPDGGVGTVEVSQPLNVSIEGGPVAQVPEPGMLSLLGLGLAGIALTRRRRNVAA